MVVAASCCLRHLPAVLRGSPATPLRALCVAAFDFVHRRRTGGRLSSRRASAASAILDLGGHANRFLDAKGFARGEYTRLRRAVRGSAAGAVAAEYLARLRGLERGRPRAGGSEADHADVVAYREAVAAVSLGAVASVTLGLDALDDGVGALRESADTATLLRLVMLCQVIDDLLDVHSDAAAGLPSLMTAHREPGRALHLTARALRRYSRARDWQVEQPELPLRLALVTSAAAAHLVCSLRRWELGLVAG